LMIETCEVRKYEFFKPYWESNINLRHPVVGLARGVDWDFVGRRFGSVCSVAPGQPPLSTRLVAGLFILKHMHNLSDEELCDRWETLLPILLWRSGVPTRAAV